MQKLFLGLEHNAIQKPFQFKKKRSKNIKFYLQFKILPTSTEQRTTKYIYLSFDVLNPMEAFTKLVIAIVTNSNLSKLTFLNSHPIFVF